MYRKKNQHVSEASSEKRLIPTKQQHNTSKNNRNKDHLNPTRYNSLKRTQEPLNRNTNTSKYEGNTNKVTGHNYIIYFIYYFLLFLPFDLSSFFFS